MHSFITCNDPKGVVECGTIRKPRSRSIDHTEIETQKSRRKDEKMVSKGVTEGFCNPSSLQLMEISRGAQNLTRMIDSWSKNKESKDVAKDLLIGALDLQESLALLNKMQEAPKYKEKTKLVKKDEEGIKRRTNSFHFGDRSLQLGFEKPRISVDGSSRDCYEELRKVIRDGLEKQNLLLESGIGEKAGFYGSNNFLDLGSDIPSTSSSQSSLSRTNNCSSSDSPFSSTASEKKVKGPSLIAKLMGLEDLPSKPKETAVNRESKNERSLSEGRYVYDIDMSNVRKCEKQERRTLKEILETAHLKGLMKSNNEEDLKSCLHHPNDSYSRNGLTDDSQPIVLIKPRRCQLFKSEERLDRKSILKQMKEKGGDLKQGKTGREAKARESLMSRQKEVSKIKQKGPTKSKTSIHRPKKTEVIEKKTDKTLKGMAVSRKVVGKEVVKSVIVSKSHDQPKAIAMKVRKPETRSNISKNLSTRKQSSAQSNTLNRTKPNVDHASKNQKRSPIKREETASETSAADPKVGNVECEEDERRIDVDITCQNDSVLIGNYSTCEYQISDDEKNDEFQTEEHLDNSKSSLSDSIMLTPKINENLKFVEVHDYDASDIQTDSKSFGSKQEESPKIVEFPDDDVSDIQTVNKSSGARTSLKLLLSRSQSFLTRAEELFNLAVNVPISSQTSGIETGDPVAKKEILLLDCANELLERRSIQNCTPNHPLSLKWLRESRILISLNRLLDEICAGIEILQNYTELSGEDLPTVGLYAMLERDIHNNRLVNAMWDSGWRYGLSEDETEQVVKDIEKTVLSGLIDEIFI